MEEVLGVSLRDSKILQAVFVTNAMALHKVEALLRSWDVGGLMML